MFALKNIYKMKNMKIGKRILYIGILYTIFCCLMSIYFYNINPYNFSYLEQWSTFIYSFHYIREVLSQPGGIVHLLSSFIVQFFAIPWTGIIITSLLLTIISVMTDHLIYICNHKTGFYPISILPSIALSFLCFNVNFFYSEIIAIIIMLALLIAAITIRSNRIKIIYIYISTPLLLIIAGPIASLYCILIITITSICNYRKIIWYLVTPIILYALALILVHKGFSGNTNSLLLPEGYFTLRLKAPSIMWLPWVMLIISIVIGLLLKHIKIKNQVSKSILYTAEITAIIVFAIYGMKHYIDVDNEKFKIIDQYSRNGNMESIISEVESTSSKNLLFQNYLNMALAEKGELGDHLFEYPCRDIQSIYVQGNKTPYLSAMLSDIYFSMGHMALSQRSAFEANESVGNFSPRMLKRLVQINIIYGNYATAQKYIKILESTLFYKNWAKSQKKFLWNEISISNDSLLSSKRKCIFPDNRFSGIKGLDDDLLHIIISNPSHSATQQYLCSLYLLSKDLTSFMKIITTFYGTSALPKTLPIYFQEGIIFYAQGESETLDKYNINKSVIDRFNKFCQEPSTDKKSLWYFLRFTN